MSRPRPVTSYKRWTVRIPTPLANQFDAFLRQDYYTARPAYGARQDTIITLIRQFLAEQQEETQRSTAIHQQTESSE